MPAPSDSLSSPSHDLALSADATRERRQRLIDSVDPSTADAILVTHPINVSYLTGFSGDSTYLLQTRDECVLLSDGRYEVQLAQECPGLPVCIRPPSQTMVQLIEEVLRGQDANKRPERVALESEHVSISQFQSLSSQLESVTWVPINSPVAPIRQVKDELEISWTRRAVQIAEAAFEKVTAGLDRATNEAQIAWELETEMRQLGAEGASFEIIAAVGETGALPHYRPQKRKIGEETTLLIDWGAKFNGYASDISRTLHREHASDRFKRAYQAVLDAQMAAIEAIEPGKTGAQIDQVARKVLEKHGLAEAFSHSLGHGTGLQIHEGPRLSAAANDELQPGMIVTVEPGVYFQGDFGIRIEDDVLVTPDGCEVLTSLPKGLDDCRIML